MDLQPFFWYAAVGTAATAGVLLFWSECAYMHSIWKKIIKPNPVTWIIWTLGAWILVRVEWVGWERNKNWAFSEVPPRIGFFVVIAMTTTLIALLATFVGKGRAYLGVREVACFALAILGVSLWYKFDAPWVAFWSALTIDFAGAWPTLVAVRRRPWDEPLFPWKLTVASAVFNVISLSILTAFGGESWTSLVFGVYYLVANYFILTPLVAYYGGLKHATK
ncbi:TPA: hypothetical protein DIS55_00540 [Candidatus Kaiserbacteria bacterium]|uniref:Uncharacterized protein n=1 Tax=Candidatus Kaiserbacteria bacterium RIFCSPLOWO2_12_FULL_50_28 TaxID=1798527 RepID=A0A1F6FML5_9BACT|nr:MAG: hypothetical protein A3H15_02645 [Candidatus Kaiserbacteria bacterium RIFCSPLOWO2_12_FULL_50_28]HCM43426.1 hypothetical protein [Candidatus Kaiserbacteria bacterium]